MKEYEEAGNKEEWENEGHRLYRSFRRKLMLFVIQKMTIFDSWQDKDNGLLNKQGN